ncbi:MAG: hypothetical protein JSS27_17640 [Planctomycetes bacterium]|nr:hypothetical protein [Planctomycetota bacterium]
MKSPAFAVIGWFALFALGQALAADPASKEEDTPVAGATASKKPQAAPAAGPTSKASTPAVKVPDGSATPAQVRTAVEQSLPFIEREGLAWMQKNACISCHQVPSMVWATQSAHERGLPVDTAKLARWSEWATSNGLRRAVFFNVTGDLLKKFEDGKKFPEEVTKKLGKLKDQRFVFADDFDAALAKNLGDELLAAHGKPVTDAAAKTKQGGAGSSGDANQQTALLLARADRAANKPAEDRLELLSGMAKFQAKDGSWPIAGQFRGQQRSLDEAKVVTAMWAVWALASAGDLPADAQAALQRGREFLKAAKPGVTTEQLLLETLLAEADSQHDRAKELTAELIKLQHADGGWGYLKEREESDAYTTGMVLYGLGRLGCDGRDAAVGRAWQYLVANQAADGSWPQGLKVISANKKEDTKLGDAVYTYWASTWAAIGMLETLPR